VAEAGLNVWTTSGPEGGEIGPLAVDPDVSGVVYAGGAANGFKTSTGGGFWTRMKDLQGAQLLALAIDP
jgi:hypothetical protein